MKNDTKKGKLNRKLYECLNKPPQNDKKTQTNNDFKEKSCQCELTKRKRRHVNSVSPKPLPVQNYPPESIVVSDNSNSYSGYEYVPINSTLTTLPKIPQSVTNITAQGNANSPLPNHRGSIESDPDELMLQLEKLFQGDQNDNDIFEGVLCDRLDMLDDSTKKAATHIMLDTSTNNTIQDSVIENHAAQIKSLDERLASLTGLLINNDSSTQKTDSQKPNKHGSSKWLCEEYHLKHKLYELLDQIGDNNRKNLEKVNIYNFVASVWITSNSFSPF